MARLVDVLLETRKLFRHEKIENADLDARLLVEFITSTTRMDEILNPARPVTDDEQKRLNRVIEQRLGGMPVYRIIGKREFFGIDFLLSEDTLEPRADTETLVIMILPFLANVILEKKKAKILDMGTGTGAIAIAALANVQNAHATAVDISDDALKTAKINAKNAGVGERFTAIKSDWFENIQGTFDLIVSNPPYIRECDISALAREVREHDPARALAGGKDGLDFYRKLARESARFLEHNGRVAVEIGKGQHDDVKQLFDEAGFKLVETRKDLNGILRALMFSRL